MWLFFDASCRAKSRICRWSSVMWTFTQRYFWSRESPPSFRRTWPITAFCLVNSCMSCCRSPRYSVYIMVHLQLFLWYFSSKILFVSPPTSVWIKKRVFLNPGDVSTLIYIHGWERLLYTQCLEIQPHLQDRTKVTISTKSTTLDDLEWPFCALFHRYVCSSETWLSELGCC